MLYTSWLLPKPSALALPHHALGQVHQLPARQLHSLRVALNPNQPTAVRVLRNPDRHFVLLLDPVYCQVQTWYLIIQSEFSNKQFVDSNAWIKEGNNVKPHLFLKTSIRIICYSLLVLHLLESDARRHSLLAPFLPMRCLWKRWSILISV